MLTIYSDSFPLDPSKVAVGLGRLNRSALISRRPHGLPFTHAQAPSGSFAGLLMRFWGLSWSPFMSAHWTVPQGWIVGFPTPGTSVAWM